MNISTQLPTARYCGRFGVSSSPRGPGFDSPHFTERLWQVQVLRMESLVHCKILCNCAHHTQVEFLSHSVSETRVAEYEAISQSLCDGNCALRCFHTNFVTMVKPWFYHGITGVKKYHEVTTFRN